MSTDRGENEKSRDSGFDFRTVVSLAAIVAACAAIYFAVTVDTSDKVADLEGSLKSLNAKVNELPTSDSVTRLIEENVTLPPAGPSGEEVQALIDKNRISTEEIQAQIDKSVPTAQDIQAQIDKSVPTAQDIQAQIDKAVPTAQEIQAQIDKSVPTAKDIQAQIKKSSLGEPDVQAMIDKAVLTEQDVQSLIEEPIEGLRGEIRKMPDEDKTRVIAREAAEAGDRRLIASEIPGLVNAKAVPKGAVVAFATSCPTEFGWKEYEAARGRFLVAVGEHADGAGTKRNFVPGIGDDDGEYRHTLDADEMPAHRHGVDRQGPTRGIEGLPPIGSDGAIIATIEQEMTHPAGKGKSHNTVPPYIALYFCEKT